jgi:hypothetical protein
VAVADLLLAVGITLEILGTIFMSLEINSYFCVFKVIVVGVSFATSGKLLIYISFDRFYAIMFPIKHLTFSQKSNCKRIHIAVVWIISMLTALIPAFVNLKSSNVKEDCHFDRVLPWGMSLYAAVFILLQFVINVILCLLVIWRLRKNTLSRQKCIKSLVKCGYLIKGYVLFVIC